MGNHATWQEPGLTCGLAVKLTLAVMLAVGLIFGPLVADAAWDHDAHVTPEQAMLHWALEAQGIAHHHHLESSAASFAPDAIDGPILTSGNSGPNFGSPLPVVSISLTPPCLPLSGCAVLAPPASLSDLHDTAPEPPPPRTP